MLNVSIGNDGTLKKDLVKWDKYRDLLLKCK